jgi:DNA-binding transcriptional MerR regulator
LAAGEKAPDAFRTIGELSADLGVAQHILRYWETKFPQLKPLQRAGNRRYYRPADVALAKRIHRLLNEEGYTVKGVQKLLRSKTPADDEPVAVPPSAVTVLPPSLGVSAREASEQVAIDFERLLALRARLAAALEG